MSVQVTIPGRVGPDGTLELDDKVPMPEGRVIVTVVQLSQDELYWQLSQPIQPGRTASENASTTGEEIDAETQELGKNDEAEDHKRLKPKAPNVQNNASIEVGTSRLSLAGVLAKIHAGQTVRGYQGRTVEEMETDDVQGRTEDEEYEKRWRAIWGETPSGQSIEGLP
jgi:hypothetical protein